MVDTQARPVERTRSSVPSAAWMLTTAAVCAGLAAVNLLIAPPVRGDAAYIVGYNLPITLLAGILLALVFRKKEVLQTHWLGAALIFISLAAASVVAFERNKKEFRQVANDLSDSVAAVKQVMAADFASAPASMPPPAVITDKPSFSGEGQAARMGQLINGLLKGALALRRAYEQELAVIGLPQLLDSKRVATDQGMRESREMLRKCRLAVDKFSAQNLVLLQQFRKQIEDSDLDAAARQSMLRGYDEASSKSRSQLDTMWGMEREVLSIFDQIINLLESRRAAWGSIKGQFTFQEQADLDQFNAYLGQVQVIVAKQQQMQAKSVDKMQSALDGMKR